MTDEIIKTDICIIGGGSGGLSVAAGAAQMGAKTVLFERGKMGGDCLNTGCVPSKALLEAAKIAKIATHGSPSMGITAGNTQIDFAAVRSHIRDVIAVIAPHDSEERFRTLGVNVIRAEASFTDPDSVTAMVRKAACKCAGQIFCGDYWLSPCCPAQRVKDVAYFTNETIFNLTEKPRHLVIIGGGPIGIEMAQAHRRLGCQVTVLEAFAIMRRDDPDLVARLMVKLSDEGIRLVEQARITTITQKRGSIFIELADDEPVEGTHLLVAAGRKPNIEALNLEAARVKYDTCGIQTDNSLRTSNRRIFAIGDAAGRHQLTHVAGYHAGIAIRNILFKLPAKIKDNAIPWVTYTDQSWRRLALWNEALSRFGAGNVRRTDWELQSKCVPERPDAPKGLSDNQ